MPAGLLRAISAAPWSAFDRRAPPRLLRAISAAPSERGRGVGYSSPVQSEYP